MRGCRGHRALDGPDNPELVAVSRLALRGNLVERCGVLASGLRVAEGRVVPIRSGRCRPPIHPELSEGAHRVTQGIGESSAAGSGDPEADLMLGTRLLRMGNREAAREALVSAVRSGHPAYAPEAALHLGGLLNDLGDPGAQTAFQYALDSGHAVHAPAAAVELGIILAARDLRAEAEAAFNNALSSGHPDHAPRAALHLGMLLDQHGDTEAAQQAFRVAIDSGHPYNAPPAAIALGQLLQSGGDTDGARAAYQNAVDSGHPDVAETATERLNSMDDEHAAAAAAEEVSVTESGRLIARHGNDVEVVAVMPDDMSDEAAVQAELEDALMVGIDELARIHSTPPEGAQELLLPVLLPVKGTGAIRRHADDGAVGAGAGVRPLMVSGHQVAAVAFARLSPGLLRLEPVRPDADVEVVEADALAGLRMSGLGWQPFTFGDDDGGEIDMSGVLECTDHPAAASGVLDDALLRDAQRQLGGRRIVVAFPALDTLIAARADLPPERLVVLARVAAFMHLEAEDPVTHLLCYATDGVLDGMYEGSDAALVTMTAEYLSDDEGVDADRFDAPHDDGAPLGLGAPGPILPILEPLAWENTRLLEREDGTTASLESLAQPLLLAGHQVGFVAYARHSRNAASTILLASRDSRRRSPSR